MNAVVPTTIAALASLACSQDLVLRGGEPAPAGDVIAATSEGVVVDADASEPVIVPWHRVLRVERAGVVDELAEGERLWRALWRVERGDTPQAEPTLEAIFADRVAERGPTTRAVAAALTRCRLGRGARLAAIDSWLVWLAAGRTGSGPMVYEPRREVFGLVDEASLVPHDEATGLVPQLPPIFRASHALRVRTETAPLLAATDGRAESLESLYRRAAAIAFGDDAAVADAELRDGRPGVALVAAVVAVQATDPSDAPSNARRLLQRVIEREPNTWQEAWSRVAIGRHLLRSSDQEVKREGVLELLHVPARFGDTLPDLAALALADSIEAMQTLGDSNVADRLAREVLIFDPAIAASIEQPSQDSNADSAGDG
ncbi:MAG: hypothetical protein AAF747_09155 [Planctomycetota bacterium]